MTIEEMEEHGKSHVSDTYPLPWVIWEAAIEICRRLEGLEKPPLVIYMGSPTDLDPTVLEELKPYQRRK